MDEESCGAETTSQVLMFLVTIAAFVIPSVVVLVSLELAGVDTAVF